MRAGIVVTGTEVITGTIQDKNGPWISQELAGRGVEVSHIVVVGDRPSTSSRRSASWATTAWT